MYKIRVYNSIKLMIIPCVCIVIFIYANYYSYTLGLTITSIFAYLLSIYMFLCILREELNINDGHFAYTPVIGKRKEWDICDIAYAQSEYFNQDNKLILYDKNSKKLCSIEGNMVSKEQLIMFLKEHNVNFIR